MHNSSTRKDAEIMFVEQGYSMCSILKELGSCVSRTGLYRWRREDKWDEKKRMRDSQSLSHMEKVEELISNTLDKLGQTYEQNKANVLCKLISAKKDLLAIEAVEEKKIKEEEGQNKNKVLSPEAVKEIMVKVCGFTEEEAAEF